jgi:hypothetical protein
MGFSAFLLLYFMKSGTINELISGNFMGLQLTDGMAVMFGLFWWVPWAMAWLSLTLKGAANRWTNFILGIVFFVLLIGDMIMNAGISSPAMLVAYVVCILVAALIAWYAWKLPKEEAQTITA